MSCGQLMTVVLDKQQEAALSSRLLSFPISVLLSPLFFFHLLFYHFIWLCAVLCSPRGVEWADFLISIFLLPLEEAERQEEKEAD